MSKYGQMARNSDMTDMHSIAACWETSLHPCTLNPSCTQHQKGHLLILIFSYLGMSSAIGSKSEDLENDQDQNAASESTAILPPQSKKKKKKKRPPNALDVCYSDKSRIKRERKEKKSPGKRMTRLEYCGYPSLVVIEQYADRFAVMDTANGLGENGRYV
jgi:hypothetical protein